jgi:AAA+ ATPase superfamily predicted ATPase/DNA-binding Xre family transcriptional regulator
MPRSPGYRRSLASKPKIEQALASKGLKPRDDINILDALEQQEIFIAAKTWQRFWEGKQNIHRSTFIKICQFLELDWQEIVESSQNPVPDHPVPAEPNFYGRIAELATLTSWVTNPNCRLIVLYGLAGIGKSSLVGKLIERVGGSFGRVEWKTFSYGDSVKSTLIDLLQQLDSDNSYDNLNPPQLKERLWQQLQQRCLIILEQEQNEYIDKFDEYKQLLRKLLQSQGKSHQSCILLITSYEKPDEVTAVANHRDAAQSLRLNGVDVATGLEILKNKEPKLLENPEAAARLVVKFDGYPLALKLVSSHIRDRYNGNIEEFLTNITVPQSIEGIVKQLIEDLDAPAKAMLNILKDTEPMSQSQLHDACLERQYSDLEFIRAKDILERRSLLSRYESDTQNGREFLFGLAEITRQVI